MTDWMDGKTAPQNGIQFIAAWRIQKVAPDDLIKLARPGGGVIRAEWVPGEARLLQRVWWDGKNVYSDPDYWMPLPEAKP